MQVEHLSHQLCYLVLPVILQWCITCILNSPYWQDIFRTKGITNQNKSDSNTPFNFIKGRGAVYIKTTMLLTYIKHQQELVQVIHPQVIGGLFAQLMQLCPLYTEKKHSHTLLHEILQLPFTSSSFDLCPFRQWLTGCKTPIYLTL